MHVFVPKLTDRCCPLIVSPGVSCASRRSPVTWVSCQRCHVIRNTYELSHLNNEAKQQNLHAYYYIQYNLTNDKKGNMPKARKVTCNPSRRENTKLATKSCRGRRQLCTDLSVVSSDKAIWDWATIAELSVRKCNLSSSWRFRLQQEFLLYADKLSSLSCYTTCGKTHPTSIPIHTRNLLRPGILSVNRAISWGVLRPNHPSNFVPMDVFRVDV